MVGALGRSVPALTEFIWTTAEHIHNRFQHLLYWHDSRPAKTSFDCARTPSIVRERHSTTFSSLLTRTHTIKYQSIVTPDGLIIHMDGPYSERRHDCYISQSSELESISTKMYL
ncbi:hypothetical protein V1505DRAFT_381333 [Lipomyces doorenjongii]